MTDKPQTINKKEYQEPRLRVYGDLQKLTGLINNPGAMTDAMFGSSKSG